ncbi:YbjP/YqhG family protein [Rahnella perminowiae]|uniref:YbjP/YqhG family protein n=1 Tax=Rahnella perminowiae TaxID=2816244 RepID=UPI001C2729D9|nr:YbjP/YqhG family protein [Rahnella perminowiae]MBU9826831.1 YbjP/YqhG family protein [Rahnella perminowiae]
MRIFIILAVSLLAACSANTNQQAGQQVKEFYGFYLSTFAGDTPPPKYDSAVMKKYIAGETLKQLGMIYKIPEQELLGSDYFTYTQDYDAAWIPALKVGEAHDLMGGKVINVWLGGAPEEELLLLEVFVRKEAGTWKIYRVRDVTNNYEAPIFSAGRIQYGW